MERKPHYDCACATCDSLLARSSDLNIVFPHPPTPVSTKAGRIALPSVAQLSSAEHYSDATCCAGVAQVWPVLRLCHKLRIDMAHFCTDLQTYIAFEVLQVGLLLPPDRAHAAAQSQGQPILIVAVA